MLETIESLGAALVVVNVGTSELLLGFVVALGFIGCAVQGREHQSATQ